MSKVWGPQVANRVPVIEVVVTEELDAEAVPRLDARLSEALQLRPAQLIVDLAGCPRIDAAAIDLLVQVHRRARRAGGLLTLRAPSARLRRNLELARVDRVLHVTASTDSEAQRHDGSGDPAGTAAGSDVETR